jgi:coenzyme F420-reducing hydrogenase delta subunit
MNRFKPVNVELSAEKQAEAERIFERIKPQFEAEARRIAMLLASKDDAQLFGQTEFELRDRVHELGAEAMEATAAERSKKGGLSGS